MPYCQPLNYTKYVKNFDLNARVKVFKATIRVNGKIEYAKIVNMFSFTFRDFVFDWCNNYMGDYPNCTFAKLQLTFCKQFRTFQNDEQVYLQLKNMKQKKNEKVEVYYAILLKLANSLQHRTTYSFLTIVFKSKQPYLYVAITNMKKKTL